MVGTNDVSSGSFQLDKFMRYYKNFLHRIMLCLAPRRLVVLGLLPRSYCLKRHSRNSCKCLHEAEKGNPNEVTLGKINENVIKVNRELSNFVAKIPNDWPFPEWIKIKFLDVYLRVTDKGGPKNCFGGILRDDGLHLSFKGHQFLDGILAETIETMKSKQ